MKGQKKSIGQPTKTVRTTQGGPGSCPEAESQLDFESLEWERFGFADSYSVAYTQVAEQAARCLMDLKTLGKAVPGVLLNRVFASLCCGEPL